eukprot:464942-Pelagomonas_calceolata.AAC.4
MGLLAYGGGLWGAVLGVVEDGAQRKDIMDGEEERGGGGGGGNGTQNGRPDSGLCPNFAWGM